MQHIEINGQRYPVHYCVNALIEFDELTGLDVTAGVKYTDIRKLKNQRAFAYVGLKHGAFEENKPFDATLLQVGNLLDLKGQVLEKLLRAFNKDMGIDDVEKAAQQAVEDLSDDSKKKLAGVT